MVTVEGVPIHYYAGLTLMDAIKAADKSLDAMTLVMLDGKVVPRDSLDDALLDECEIKLLQLMSGG